MKLIRNNIKPKKKVKDEERELGIEKVKRQIDVQTGKLASQYANRAIPKIRPNYKLTIYEGKEMVRLIVNDINNKKEIEVITINKDSKEKRIQKARNDYYNLAIDTETFILQEETKIVKPIKQNKPKEKLSPYVSNKPLGNDFNKWTSNKLQELVGLMDEFRFRCKYDFRTIDNKVIVDMDIRMAGTLARGIHRVVMYYDRDEYRYFFERVQKAKTKTLRELFN